MLTIFTVPKAFDGHIGLIQENAIDSWTTLTPRCEIVLFGDEEGVAEAAARAGVRHEPGITFTEHGTPRLDGLFQVAREAASFDILCFVNADILLPGGLTTAIARLEGVFDQYVALGRCRNVDVVERLGEGEWPAHGAGEMRPPGGIDYLVFTRDAYGEIPPFAVGRAGFDNWLVWEARRRRIPVIDLSSVVTAIHQNHEYTHVEGGRDTSYAGFEAFENIRLAGGELHLFNIDDASHRLTEGGLRSSVLAPVRALPLVRWVALRWGGIERAFVRRLGTPRERRVS